MNARPFAVVRSPLVLILLALSFAFVSSSPAKAVRSWEPVPFETFTVSGVCSFDLQVESLFNKGKVMTFLNDEGAVRAQLYTGALRLRITNLTTGEFVDVNSSSAAHVITHVDGTTVITLRGPWTGFVEPGTFPDFPAAWLFSGHAVLTLDASGDELSLTHTPGPVTDLCAELA